MPYFLRIDTVVIMNWLIGTEYLFHRWPCTCVIYRSARNICFTDDHIHVSFIDRHGISVSQMTMYMCHLSIGTEYLFHRWPCTCAIYRSARDICVHDYTCAIYRSINDLIVSCLRSWCINGCLTWAIRHTLRVELLSTLISFSGVHVAHSVNNCIGSALSFSLSHSLLFIFIAIYNM